MKRFVAAILAVVMLLSTFSFTALAAAPEQLPQTDPAVQQLQTTALPPVGLDTRPYAAAMGAAADRQAFSVHDQRPAEHGPPPTA